MSQQRKLRALRKIIGDAITGIHKETGQSDLFKQYAAEGCVSPKTHYDHLVQLFCIYNTFEAHPLMQNPMISQLLNHAGIKDRSELIAQDMNAIAKDFFLPIQRATS